MAKLDKVAASYAKAIFDYLGTDGRIEPVIKELSAVAEAVKGHAELSYVLNTDVFSEKQRAEVCEDVAAKLGLSTDTKRVLVVLAENRRLGEISQIAQRLRLLQLNAANVVPLSVETAVSLDDGEKQKIELSFQKILGKKVAASYRIEPSLMGGLRITAAGRTYDGSLFGWLESFREKLVGGNI